jgi:hypothetical protein
MEKQGEKVSKSPTALWGPGEVAAFDNTHEGKTMHSKKAEVEIRFCNFDFTAAIHTTLRGVMNRKSTGEANINS